MKIKRYATDPNYFQRQNFDFFYEDGSKADLPIINDLLNSKLKNKYNTRQIKDVEKYSIYEVAGGKGSYYNQALENGHILHTQIADEINHLLSLQEMSNSHNGLCLNSDNVQLDAKSEFRQGHRYKVFNDRQIDKINQMKSQKISNVKIAKVFGVSEKTIRNYLKGMKGIEQQAN